MWGRRLRFIRLSRGGAAEETVEEGSVVGGCFGEGKGRDRGWGGGGGWWLG